MAASVTLGQPIYIAPLPDGENVVAPDQRIRQIALVSAVSIDDEVCVGVGRVSVVQTAGRKPWSLDAQIAVEWYDDLNDVCEVLENLFIQAPSRAGIPYLPRGWWIGGGKGTASAVPEDWRINIAAVGRVAGYDIEVFEAAGARLELPDRISNEKPACLIDWRAYTIGKAQAIVRRYRQDVPHGLYVPLDGGKGFDTALSLLRRELRQQALLPMAIPSAAPDDPSTVSEAVEIAMEECTELVFLDTALVSAKQSSFPRPTAALRFLRAMNEVVKGWRAGDVDGDGFASVFENQGVSGYRPGISPTAAHEYPGDYERLYRGETITLGPHIANGVGSVTRILRIYWWVDKVERTFVVGHVGRKLRDASNR
jgi:hypothetical protein